MHGWLFAARSLESHWVWALPAPQPPTFVFEQLAFSEIRCHLPMLNEYSPAVAGRAGEPK